MKEQTVAINGLRLSYAEAGRGPSLLLLHGLSYDRRSFEPVLSELAARFRVYALDLRGHGGSGRAGRYQLRDYVADVQAFADAVLPQSYLLYGHSLGALTALGLAAARPAAVAGLVLEDVPLFYRHTRIRDTAWAEAFAWAMDLTTGGLTLEQLTAQLQAAQPRIPEPLLRARARMLQQVDPGTMAAFIDHTHMDGFDQDAALAAVACPTLLLRGDPAKGGVLGAKDLAYARERLADSRVVDFDCGHYVHASRPSQVLEALERWCPVTASAPSPIG